MSRTDNPLILSTVQALRRALPPGLRLLLAAAVGAVRATPGVSLWAVGGAVRDRARSRGRAAGLEVRDLDLSTDGDVPVLARAIAARLEAAAPGATTTHIEPRFGTASVTYTPNPIPTPTTGAGEGGGSAQARHGGHRLDLAALRTERYARPGALPVVRLLAARSGAAGLPGGGPVETAIEADLARRDFSVNAVALGVAGPALGRLVDPFDGLADLAARRLRVLHDRSFMDDGTRLWRAARFAARLRLRLDPDTACLVADAARGGALDAVSAARLWREWTLLAAEPRVGAACLLLDRWGVLRATHSALRLAPSAAHALARVHGPFASADASAAEVNEAPDVLYALIVGALSTPVRAAVGARLGAPRTAVRAAEACAQLLAVRAPTPAALARLDGTPRAARLAASRLDPARQPALQRALTRWERTLSPLDARTMIALGVTPGPAIGALLARLRRARYLGNLGDAVGALARVRRWRDAASRQDNPVALNCVNVEKRSAL